MYINCYGKKFRLIVPKMSHQKHTGKNQRQMVYADTIRITQKSPLRFGEIQSQIADATSKMLTSALCTLEEDGIISRTVYAEVPPCVEYSITERGRELMECMQPLILWTNTHMEEILRDRVSKINNS